MKKNTLLSLVLGASLLGGGVAFLNGCGSDDTPSDATGNNAGATSAASVGGAVQGSDSGATAYLDTVPQSRWRLIGTDLFGVPEASATVCGVGGLFAGLTCSAGVETVTFGGCTSRNLRNTFNGGESFTFATGGTSGAPGTTGCLGATPWATLFTTANDSVFRSYASGTSVANVIGVTVAANNTNPTGWDTGVTLTKNSTYSAYGWLRYTSGWVSGTHTSTQVLTNYGVEHVATMTSKKGNTVTVWDHTISTDGNGLTVTHTYNGATDTKIVSTTDANSHIIVQHNLAKWTGKSTMNAVTYVHGTTGNCGCYPTAGTITTLYTGSKTGCEIMTFGASSECGSYSVQAYSDNACTTAVGSAITGTLNQCL